LITVTDGKITNTAEQMNVSKLAMPKYLVSQDTD